MAQIQDAGVTQVSVKEFMNRTSEFLRKLRKLDEKQRKQVLDYIRDLMARRSGITLCTLEGGSPRACRDYIFSLVKSTDRAQFLHALVAFQQNLTVFKQRARKASTCGLDSLRELRNSLYKVNF